MARFSLFLLFFQFRQFTGRLGSGVVEQNGLTDGFQFGRGGLGLGVQHLFFCLRGSAGCCVHGAEGVGCGQHFVAAPDSGFVL